MFVQKQADLCSIFSTDMRRATHLFGRALRETGQAMDRLGLTFSSNEIYKETFSRHRPVMNLFDKVTSFFGYQDTNCTELLWISFFNFGTEASHRCWMLCCTQRFGYWRSAAVH